jgi:hypothetical protein
MASTEFSVKLCRVLKKLVISLCLKFIYPVMHEPFLVFILGYPGLPVAISGDFRIHIHFKQPIEFGGISSHFVVTRQRPFWGLDSPPSAMILVMKGNSGRSFFNTNGPPSRS